jgi:hypothetical protein
MKKLIIVSIVAAIASAGLAVAGTSGNLENLSYLSTTPVGKILRFAAKPDPRAPLFSLQPVGDWVEKCKILNHKQQYCAYSGAGVIRYPKNSAQIEAMGKYEVTSEIMSADCRLHKGMMACDTAYTYPVPASLAPRVWPRRRATNYGVPPMRLEPAYAFVPEGAWTSSESRLGGAVVRTDKGRALVRAPSARMARVRKDWLEYGAQSFVLSRDCKVMSGHRRTLACQVNVDLVDSLAIKK